MDLRSYARNDNSFQRLAEGLGKNGLEPKEAVGSSHLAARGCLFMLALG